MFCSRTTLERRRTSQSKLRRPYLHIRTQCTVTWAGTVLCVNCDNHVLFHRHTRTAYLYNGCLAWYNVLMGPLKCEIAVPECATNKTHRCALQQRWNKCVNRQRYNVVPTEDFCPLKFFPTLFGGAPSLILFNNLYRRQKVRETDLRTPRSRMCPRWPN